MILPLAYTVSIALTSSQTLCLLFRDRHAREWKQNRPRFIHRKRKEVRIKFSQKGGKSVDSRLLRLTVT